MDIYIPVCAISITLISIYSSVISLRGGNNPNSLWGPPSIPIDLSELSSVSTEEVPCIIFVTNLIGFDLTGNQQPVIIRGKFKSQTASFLARRSIQIDVVNYVIRSKSWNCQVEIDMIPLYLEKPTGEVSNLEDFDAPDVWEHKRYLGIYRDELHNTLPTSSPVVHVFMAPAPFWSSDHVHLSIWKILSTWMQKIMRRRRGNGVNIEFFLAALVITSTGSFKTDMLWLVTPIPCLQCDLVDQYNFLKYNMSSWKLPSLVQRVHGRSWKDMLWEFGSFPDAIWAVGA